MTEAENEQASQLGSFDLLFKTLSLWIKNPLKYAIMFGLTMMALQFVILAALAAMFNIIGLFLYSYVAMDPLMFGLNFFLYSGSSFSFSEMWIPFMSIALASVLVTAILRGVVVGPTTMFVLDNYETQTSDMDQSLKAAGPRINEMVKTEFYVVGIQLMIIGPVLVLLQFAYSLYLIDPGASFFTLMSEFMLMGAIGIIFYIYLRLLPIAAIIMKEDVSAREAIQRSFDLTSGHMLYSSIGFISLIMIEFVFIWILAIVLGLLGAFGAIGYFMANFFLITFIVSPLRVIFSAVLYRNLCERETE
ncbi:MAG: hypothetical protein RTU92_12975 [Candidatus Thorarchaeota archaeon]